MKDSVIVDLDDRDLEVPAVDVTADVTRRQYVIGSHWRAALLAACGDDGGSATDAPSTRMITDSRGQAEVPVAPERVAALVGSAEIDVMLLGLDPVFSGTYASGWVELPEGI